MGLSINKGSAPATGKVVKRSRAEELLQATAALATTQLPDEETMSAIEGERPSRDGAGEAPEAGQLGRAPQAGDQSSSPVAPLRHRAGATGASVAVANADAAARTGADRVERVSILGVRPSPFQPKGRPSAAAVSAVRLAIAESGSLEALVSPEGATLFGKLEPEAARLAELAYDISQHGVRVPIELRTAEDGALECLGGHRRLAAAALAGLDAIPALLRGEMSSAAAAATVLSGNLHRENFTTWQEAVLVTEVQERRRADGHRDNVRSLGSVMGWSHGKVNMLLRIRRALAPAFLARVSGEGGDVGAVEEALSRAAYRDLERLANEGDEERRLAATRRMLGLGGTPAASPRERSAVLHRPKRGGGFMIEVNDAVETLGAADAMVLRELLETQLARVTARLERLG
jgi:ParB family chromosome partitioning protein